MNKLNRLYEKKAEAEDHISALKNTLNKIEFSKKTTKIFIKNFQQKLLDIESEIEEEEEDKPKENMVDLYFCCGSENFKDCVYFKKDKDECIYSDVHGVCTYSVAMVNAMILKFKELGVEVKITPAVK